MLLALMAMLDICEKRAMGELLIVRDFHEVFPEDVSDFSPEREV